MTSSDNVAVRNQYRVWEGEYRQFRDAERYREARETLQKMINLIQTHSTVFDEPDDRVKILEARKVMLSINEERIHGGRSVAALYRELAEWSTPSVCLDQPCRAVDPQLCITKRETLSPRQAKMCIEKINAVCHALKIEAALAVQDFDYQQVLEKRQLAVKNHEAVLRLDRNKKRVQNQTYLEYWYYVTEGYVSLLSGHFGSSKDWFGEALIKARLLDQERCFPNYFRDLSEIRAHEFYIDGLDRVRSAQFGDAREKFRGWLDLNPERKNDLRHDNMVIFEKCCDILERLPRQEVQGAEWKELEKLLDRGYVARTTWALWTRLQWLRELSFKLKSGDPDYLKFDLQLEVNKLAQEWKLFIPDSVLLGDDRTAGLRRRMNLPSFIDIFDHIDSSRHNWQQLLLQNLKNLFLLMADYEHRRYLNPPPQEADLPRTQRLLPPSEKMTIPELGNLILRYLGRRSKAHEDFFRNALSNLDRLKAAIQANDFNDAVAAQMDLLEMIRSWPHIVLVREQEEIPQPVFLDEENPRFFVMKTTAGRLWNREPKEIIFEGPQTLKKGSYYYLRPRWNVRSPDQYRIRHEQFHQSDLPRWVNVFFTNLIGKGKTDPRKFGDWILQFEESERLLACRLFDALHFYDEEESRQVWAKTFRKLPAGAKRDAAYIGLGHGAKSGRLNPYQFRQGVSKLPEYDVLFAGREMKIFRDISEYEKEELKLPKPETIVFLDDFIGIGGQAEDFLEWYFPHYPWLCQVSIYFCVLVGFRKSIEQVKNRLHGKVKDVIAGELLDERDRAFSSENSIWASSEECGEAEQWAKELGCQLLKGNPFYDAERDALGWHGCQALVTFHHNIPSDT